MKKSIITLFIFATVLIVPVVIEAAPRCPSNATPNLQISDPACYTSSTSTSTSTVYDTHNCSWIKTADECGLINSSCRWSHHVTARPIGSCSSSCSTSGYYLHPNPNAGYYRNSCTGATICGNAGIPNPGTYTTSRQVTTTSTSHRCYYTTVDSWSDCSATGIQSATAVTQHQTTGTTCHNLNEATTRTCGVCDPTTEGQGTGIAPEPESALCLFGDAHPVPPVLNTITNLWEWECLGENATANADDITCSAPRNEDGECATTAGGEYIWSETDFRGELCSGGTLMEPNPTFPNYGETVTWGCQQIGDPTVTTSTATGACTATRHGPQPGICESASNDGLYVDPPTDLCYDPNYLNEPRVVNNDFAVPNPLTGAGPWNWTCNGSNTTVDSALCSARCKPEITIDESDRTFVVGEGDTEVTITINYDTTNCVTDYVCNVEGQDIALENSAVDVTFIYDGNLDIVCNDGDGNTIIPDTDQTVMTAFCVEKSCNAQGTCQATSKAGVITSNDCSSTCNSNADCSSGRIIETRP